MRLTRTAVATNWRQQVVDVIESCGRPHDHEVAARLATSRPTAARGTRGACRRNGSRAKGSRGQWVPRLPDGGAHPRTPGRRRTVRKKAPTTRCGCAPNGCGPLTCWTAPGSSPNWAVRTGSCTSRLAIRQLRSPARLRFRRRASRLATPDPAPPPAYAGEPRIVVSRTRPPAIALQVRDHLHGTLVAMGSAGAKVAAVIQGLADAMRTPADCTSGFGGAGRGGPRGGRTHPPASTVRRWRTTGPIRCCPTWWCADANSPTPCWPSPGLS